VHFGAESKELGTTIEFKVRGTEPSPLFVERRCFVSFKVGNSPVIHDRKLGKC